MAAALRESRARVTELGEFDGGGKNDERRGRKARALVFPIASFHRFPLTSTSRLSLASINKTNKQKKTTEAEVAELRAELSPSPPPTSSTSSSSPSTNTTGTITLRYSTGWQEAFVHFSRDGRAWTAVPGVKLVEAPNSTGGDRELRIEGARRLDFVMTDGRGNWDTPVPSYAAHNGGGGGGGSGGSGSGSDSDGGGRSASPKHYSIEEPGTWRLKSGKLTKLD